MDIESSVELPNGQVHDLEKRAHDATADDAMAKHQELIAEISRNRKRNPPFPEDFDIDEAINEGHR